MLKSIINSRIRCIPQQFSTVAAEVASTRPSLVLITRQSVSPRILGSKVSRYARSRGLIPGIVYGRGSSPGVVSIPIYIEQKVLEAQIRKYGASFENILYDLEVDGVKYLVTPRQIQFNPITEKPINVNFLIYRPGNRIRIPIDFINSDMCMDLKRGNCYLIQVNPFIECICADTIPPTIEADLSALQKGDVIKLAGLTFPPGVTPSKNVISDFVAGVIRASRK